MVPPINYKEEREEDMVANLRVGFKERQRKRLFESITVISFPSKIPCPEILCPEPVLAIALALVPSTTTTGSNLLVEEAARLALERPSSDLAHLNDDSVEFVASIPSHPLASRAPNREEIAELMKQIPCFTEREAPVHNMGVLFLATWRV